MTHTVKDPKKTRSNILFLIEFARPFRVRIGFGMILALLTSLCFLAMGEAIREMLARLNTSPLVPQALYHSALKVFLFFCGGNLCLFSRIYTFGRLGERMVWVMRDRIFQRLLSQEMPFFESHKVGDLTARIISDAQALRTLTIGVVSDAFKSSVFIIGGMVMMIHVNKLAAGITFLALLIYSVPTFIMHQRMRKVARQGCAVIGDITSSCEEYLNAIRTVKVLGYEPYVFDHFKHNTEREYRFFAWYIVLFGVVQALLPLAAGLSGALFVFMLWSPSFLSLLSPATVVSFFYYCGFVIFGLKGMQSVWAAFLRQGGAIERLNSLFDHTHSPEARTPGLSTPSSEGSPSIEFDHVWFHYPSAPDRWVLEDVSFCIAPGEKVAIVGPSGTGKTTLFLLLVGLYRPVRGRILIGGIDLQELDRDQVRKSIGIVQQDPLIFSGTLKDNITMGDATLTQNQVQDVLDKVHLSDFVHTLSHGLDTFLGEKGVRLSGGQKQRISLARVLLKDPSILMCDEATNALDLETEELIYSHLSLHTRAKTCLTISHRLSALIPHETTYVLSQGRMQKQDHRQRPAGSDECDAPPAHIDHS